MEVKKKKCVIMGCNNDAVGVCNNCGIPICEKHSKKIGKFYLCLNCYEYAKKLRSKQF